MKKYTKEQFAALINGREYREELTREDKKAANESGLLVFYGASDDLLEIEGAICDEFEAWNGTTIHLVPHRVEKFVCMSSSQFKEVESTFEEHCAELKSVPIQAIWTPIDLDASWQFITGVDIPHATFDIMEDGDLYCRGLVIDIDDVKKYLSV